MPLKLARPPPDERGDQESGPRRARGNTICTAAFRSSPSALDDSKRPDVERQIADSQTPRGYCFARWVLAHGRG